jgi:hypothetical protein
MSRVNSYKVNYRHRTVYSIYYITVKDKDNSHKVSLGNSTWKNYSFHLTQKKSTRTIRTRNAVPINNKVAVKKTVIH